jgi:basic amino acid/polyamine antiporter, APA family
MKKYKIGLFSATSLVVANMMGTGVFTSLGFQTIHISSGFAIVLLWLLGGGMSVCGALCYSELSASMPKSGGEFLFLSQVYHPILGFLSGWVSATVAFAAPVALSARLLAEYVSYIVPIGDPVYLACGVVIGITLIHMKSLKSGSTFQNLSTVIKVILFFVILIVGFLYCLKNGYQMSLMPTQKDISLLFSSHYAVALVFVMYSYSGWNASVYIASEIDKPEKNIPLSMTLGAWIVMALYIATVAMILYVTPLSKIVSTLEVGFVTGQYLFGDMGSKVMSGLLAFSLISSVSSMVWTGPRVTQAMGAQYSVFATLARNNLQGVPARGLLFQMSIILIMLVTSTFETILKYIGFTISVFSFLTVCGVIVYRWRAPQAPRPYKTFAYPFPALIFLLGSGWMLVYLLLEETRESLAGLATLLLGVIVYFFSGKKVLSKNA